MELFQKSRKKLKMLLIPSLISSRRALMDLMRIPATLYQPLTAAKASQDAPGAFLLLLNQLATQLKMLNLFHLPFLLVTHSLRSQFNRRFTDITESKKSTTEEEITKSIALVQLLSL